jgi:predicted patatin/cPLA2 family phospholipase
MPGPPHPVLALLAARARGGGTPGRHDDGARLALVIEGGGMRGAVSAGMMLVLHERGLVRCFDAAYGSSAGVLGAAWMLSGSATEGMATYLDQSLISEVIDPRRALRRSGPPVVDMDRLVGDIYESVAPGFFGRVLAHPMKLHPVATDVDSGATVDLHATIRDEASLRDALRASSRLPGVAGPPVRVGGRRYVDAGVSSAIPFPAALADGATHLLVLRSRQAGDRAGPPGPTGRRVVAPMLARIGPRIAELYLSRSEREGADEDLLDRHDADPDLAPPMCSIRPAPGAPTVSRLERDSAKMAPALGAGRAAAVRALLDVPSG